jgi:hypothetical protein
MKEIAGVAGADTAGKRVRGSVPAAYPRHTKRLQNSFSCRESRAGQYTRRIEETASVQ